MCIQQASTLLTQCIVKIPAGRQAGLTANSSCRKREWEVLMKTLLKTLKNFLDTVRKQSVSRYIITYHGSLTKLHLNFWAFSSSPHPQIFLFVFFLSFFSSSSTQTVFLALWVDLQDLLLTYFSIVTPAALFKKLGRTKRLSSKAAKSSNELHQWANLPQSHPALVLVSLSFRSGAHSQRKKPDLPHGAKTPESSSWV